MKKNILTAVIAVVILIQLAVPALAVADKYETLTNGTAYKFKVTVYDPYDAFRGRYVEISVLNNALEGNDNKYGVIGVGEDGFAYIERTTDTPVSGESFVKSSHRDYFMMPVNRYYAKEDIAEGIRDILIANRDDSYIVLRVKDGKSVIEGLYIGGVPIESYSE